MYEIVHGIENGIARDIVGDIDMRQPRGVGRGAMDVRLREEITERVRQGDALDDIESALLPARGSLDEDERSALWLFAWVAVEQRARFARRPGEVVEASHD